MKYSNKILNKYNIQYNINKNIYILYKDNQIESRKDHRNRFQFRSISNK